MLSPLAPISLEDDQGNLQGLSLDRPFLSFDDAFSFYFGVDINERFYAAYGHDFITSGLSSVTSGTNEFKLGFWFNGLQKAP